MDIPLIVKKMIILCLLLCFWQLTKAQSSIELQPLGQAVIPHSYSFQKTPIGGLSGLGYDQQANKFYVISDAADGRFYTFNIKLNNDGKFQRSSIQFQKVHYLHTSVGNKYIKGEIDPEGIAVGSDSVIYVSSEGMINKKVAPFVNAYSKDGTFIRALTIPKAYWLSYQKVGEWGVRSNLGFEGLAVSPDATKLYAATENALSQDGPAADLNNSSPARIIVYDLQTNNIAHEFQYDVNPIFTTSNKKKGFALNGLSDLMALDNRGHLLTLERNFVMGQGFRICIYEISTKDATDIKGIENLRLYNKPIRPVKKVLVANLKDFEIDIDNFEGLALGPKLPQGGRLLLMVSDNNFTPLEKTIFTAFRL